MAKAIGKGTTLYVTTVGSTVASANWEPVAYVRSIDGPDSQGDEVEATTLDTTGNYREYIMTLIDPGSLNFQLVWDPSVTVTDSTGTTLYQHQRMSNFHVNRTPIGWKIVLPTTTYWVRGDGYVRNFSPAIPVDDLITADVTLRISSGITWPAS